MKDIKPYIPLLKYLENMTGRRFRIKFQAGLEDTIADLGKGVTQFAVVGTLNYLTGEAKYGIRYIAQAVNKPEDAKPFSGIIVACSRSVDSKTVEAVRAALLAFEPAGKHKDLLVDWDKTEMPSGFTHVNEPDMQKLKDLAIKYGLLKE